MPSPKALLPVCDTAPVLLVRNIPDVKVELRAASR